MKADTSKKSNSGKKHDRFAKVVVQKPTVEQEHTQERLVKSDWIPFFKESNNTYVNDLALRARRSPTHGAILKSKHVFTIGGGFLFYDESGEEYEPSEDEMRWLELVNSKGESLFDVFCRVARDYIYTGNAYVEGVRVNIEGTETKRLNPFHKDSTTVRVGKEKDKFYLSNFWRDVANQTQRRKEWDIKEVEAYNGKDSQERFILHLANYEPEFTYYGLPDHHGVLKWADIEYKIPTYNLDRFENGFFPSIYMALFGEPPDGKTPNKYTTEIVETFTGEGNNSRALIEMLDSNEMKAFIHEFTTVREGEFVELQRLAVDNIISGHRWFASLAGLSTAGKLGSNQQIQSEFEIAMNTVVIPDYQQPVLALFNKIVKLAGFDFQLGIKKSSPISFLGELDPEKYILVKEARKEAGMEPLEEDDERREKFVSETKGTSTLEQGVKEIVKEGEDKPEEEVEETGNAIEFKKLRNRLNELERKLHNQQNVEA